MTRTPTEERSEVIDAEFVDDPAPQELIQHYLARMEEIDHDPFLTSQTCQQLKEAHTWALMLRLREQMRHHLPN